MTKVPVDAEGGPSSLSDVKGRITVVAACIVGVVVTSVVFVRQHLSSDGDGLRGMVRTPTPVVELAPLVDAAGATVELAPDDGHLSLVYFGYTHCPDVCPTTLYDLRDAFTEVGADTAAHYALTFVTVDPGRDDPATVDSYVSSIVDGSRGLSIGDPDVLADLAGRFGASYSVTTSADGQVEVAHSAFLYAVDTRGRLLVSWPFGTTRDELAHDLDVLAEDLDD